MKHILFGGILLLLFTFTGQAQNVKYKNLFVLLNAENYQDGGHFLRIYIKDHPEHPDANYQMGKMLAHIMHQLDPVSDSDRIMELADSAVMYLKKAAQLCTVKYIEKQHDDDYYAAFKRRDLRTGKFVVKSSDVQLDIETRVKAINKYKEDDLQLINHYKLSGNYYKNIIALYSNLTNKAKSTNFLYFTANADDLQTFRDISDMYDSCLYNFNTYRSVLKEMNNKATIPKLNVKPIASYPLSAIDSVDFSAESVEILDYKKWAKSTLDKIVREVYPLKERIIEYDKELADAHAHIVKDSIDGRPEVFGLATRNVGRDLSEYKSPSLPEAIFNYRIAEINYHSTLNFWYKEVADTANVDVKLNVLYDIKEQLKALSSLLVKLSATNADEEKLMFKDYIEARYFDNDGLEAFIQEQIAFVHEDSLFMQEKISQVKEQDKEVRWKNNIISLVVGNNMLNVDSSLFSTILVDSIKNREVAFYSWFENKDSLAFAFGLSPASRMLDTLYSLPLSAKLKYLGKENLEVLSDSIGVNERVWVVSSTVEDGGLFHIYAFTSHLNNGLLWEREIALPDQPKNIRISQADNEIILLNEKEDIIFIFDMNGVEIDLDN